MSTNLIGRAKSFFPGGVNSPVRAFLSVGCEPVFISKAAGAYVYSSTGESYIDYVGSWGPMILGHADKDVIAAVKAAAEKGLSFGASTEAESELAALIKQAFPAIDRMRFVSSGTEATMSAIRLARGYTNKPMIIKIDGAYHGHSDSLLVSAGSGVATLSIPGCPGIPDSIAKDTLVVPFNDIVAVEQCFGKFHDKIAAIIVEPVCGNMGVVVPQKDYLPTLRKLCDQNNALLIFDEVMSGFRACFGGAGDLFGVTPDLTCLGKIVGGGMPLAVYGGKDKFMSLIAPEGPVYQAGTLSGNPVAVAAGIATLKKISETVDFYPELIAKTKKLVSALKRAADEAKVPCSSNTFGSMSTLFFTNKNVYNFEDAKTSDTQMFARYFRAMLKEKIYLAPSQFEALFVSYSHTDDDILKTISAAQKAFAFAAVGRQ